MTRLPLMILIVCFLLITWAQLKMIWTSLVSFCCYAVLTVAGLESPLTHWRSELFEFWLAGIIWILTPLGLYRILRRRFLEETQFESDEFWLTSKQRLGVLIICVFAYVALTCPILVTLSPTLQGSLVTTRLLPPMSEGTIVRSTDPTELDDVDGFIGRAYRRANSFLLHQEVSVKGPGKSGVPLRKDDLDRDQKPSSQLIFALGTDDAGRDVFSRMIYGTRVSLGIGVLAALGAVLIGGIVGVMAGVSRGMLDSLLMRMTDLFLAVPPLFLVIGIVAFIGQTVAALVIVLAVTGWMSVARLVRGEVLRLRDKEFILAARMLSQPWSSIIVRHLIPNMRPVLVTAAVLQFGNAVLAEAALGFLGIGIQPPTPSWGNMMGEATGYLGSAWWLGIFPGTMLATVLVSAHLVAEQVGQFVPRTASSSK